MRQKLDLPAILEKDLRILLEHLGLAAKIEEGAIICPSCSKPITWDNVGGFVVHEGQPVLFCDTADCVKLSSSEDK